MPGKQNLSLFAWASKAWLHCAFIFTAKNQQVNEEGRVADKRSLQSDNMLSCIAGNMELLFAGVFTFYRVRGSLKFLFSGFRGEGWGLPPTSRGWLGAEGTDWPERGEPAGAGCTTLS